METAYGSAIVSVWNITWKYLKSKIIKTKEQRFRKENIGLSNFVLFKKQHFSNSFYLNIILELKTIFSTYEKAGNNASVIITNTTGIQNAKEVFYLTNHQYKSPDYRCNNNTKKKNYKY